MTALRIKLLTILFLLILVMLFSGCAGGSDGENSNGKYCGGTFAYEYAEVDADTGLILQPTISPIGNFYSYISFNRMVSEYKDVEACAANTNTPGPTVNFTSFDHFGLPGIAVYSYATQDVYINVDDDGGPERNCISDRKFLRHEYMHHILYLNGEDSSHNNPKFESCNALGPKTCNGQYCE